MPIDGGSLNYAVGPVTAVVVVCLLAVVLRWIFGNGRSRPRSARAPARPDDYGLLRSLATVPDRRAGERVRAVLTAAGIRSTLSERPDGRLQVLVFSTDLHRARPVLPPQYIAPAGPTGPPGAGAPPTRGPDPPDRS